MIIVKIGGGEKINISGVIKDLSSLKEKFIIVHGANALRDQIADELGRPKIVVKSVKGYSSVLSDRYAIDVMMMVYAGVKNKRIVEECQKNGINAIGMTGIDGGVIVGKRNNGIRVKKDGKLKILRDFSGKPQSVNSKLLNMLLDNGYVPVICPPIMDENKVAINCQNDDILRVLHIALKSSKIIQLIEAPGFLENKEDPSTLVRKISIKEVCDKEGQCEGMMKRKMYSINKLFEEGKTQVIISDGRVEHPIKDALAGKGTVIS